MKLLYKNNMLERSVIASNFVAMVIVIATFVLLYGFYEPVLSGDLLHTVQLVMVFYFLTEKLVRFFNAESKLEFLKVNWFEIPLLLGLLFIGIGAGRWFAVTHRADVVLTAVSGYLVLQVISKVCLGMVLLASSGRNPTLVLITLFVILIGVGAGMLMLPRAYTMDTMSVTDAFFTATSATCVTGLIVVDTGRDFTRMGQIVILVLIQLGGLGIVIFGAVLALMLGQALSVRESVAMQDILNAQTLGRISIMVGFIFIGTLVIEGIGAVLLYPMWDDVPGMANTGHRWFCSIFHAVSAFCNAGFSLFESSLIDYNRSWGVYAVIAPLIILGGLGFSVLYDLTQVAGDRIKRFFRRRLSPQYIFSAGLSRRLSLQTKIVLSTSLILIVVGTLLLMLFEHYSPQVEHDSRFKIALFQSITARTAGFNTVDIASLAEGSKLVILLLMFIGGSPGSTAGGIKTVTLAVVVMVVYATFRKRREVELFRRSMRLVVVARAVTVLMLFAMLLLVATGLLVLTEHDIYNSQGEKWTLLDLGFEAGSALGTVGLSTGVTETLTTPGKWIIIFTMLIGRLGPMTLVAALTFNIRPAGYDYPSEPVMVG
jgi:trk system potassium uptake protein TrkH